MNEEARDLIRSGVLDEPNRPVIVMTNGAWMVHVDVREAYGVVGLTLVALGLIVLLIVVVTSEQGKHA